MYRETLINVRSRLYRYKHTHTHARKSKEKKKKKKEISKQSVTLLSCCCATSRRGLSGLLQQTLRMSGSERR